MKIAINTDLGFEGISIYEKIRLISQAGFDGFFTSWYKDFDICSLKRAMGDNKAAIQSIHAPFSEISKIWQPGDDGDKILDELVCCIKDCRSVGADIMICRGKGTLYRTIFWRRSCLNSAGLLYPRVP